MTDGWWQKRLSDCREEVCGTDHKIMELISKRMELCIEIGEVKEFIGKPVFDPEQEIRVLEDKAKLGMAMGLDEEFVRNFMKIVMEYSKKMQSKNRAENGSVLHIFQ